jgi:hypothetical protein
MALVDMSVWIHSTPRASVHRPSGQAKASPLTLPLASARSLAGSPASTKWFHSKLVAVEVAVLLPADDVAHGVVGARVGGIGGVLVGAAAVAVVGQRAVDPALLVDVDPLRPVHLGGAQQVAGLARLDQHLALVGKAVGSGQRALPWVSGSQRPGRRRRSGHVQRAVVQQRGVGLRAAGLDAVAADELVDVLEAGVFAHVDHGTAGLS